MHRPRAGYSTPGVLSFMAPLSTQQKKVKRKDNKQSEINLLDLIPERMIEYEIDEENMVVLKAPRFKSRLLKKWLQPRLKNPYLKVKLDEIGSSVWLLCDGRRNVKEIAGILREKFQEKIEPCYDRLGKFFQQLERARFICYLNLEECRRDQVY